ncbi:MAG: 16S rRNA (cytidine(1402)-2'-O)-methyltransferase [Anaerolineales bacterium]|nr:16S rRNA (cytidine(1402)-2'-O)-methyltransferase [Anaerolineales bacterium]
MGTLYLVGTPIGNLEDITMRALRTLHEVSLIAAEDTRTTGRLLAHYQIDTPLTSFHEHNKLEKIDELLRHLETGDLAVVSDAGMPGLSDPGFVLVRASVERGLPVIPIPGPSAVISALVVSGLPTHEYVFIGFLPRRKNARQDLIEVLAAETRTMIAFEAPHRLIETLEDLDQVLKGRPMVVARELTKLFEDIQRGTPAELLAHFSLNPPRGEITLVIGGAPEHDRWSKEQVINEIAQQLETGKSPTSIAKTVAQLSGYSRREIYRLTIKKPE